MPDGVKQHTFNSAEEIENHIRDRMKKLRIKSIAPQYIVMNRDMYLRWVATRSKFYKPHQWPTEFMGLKIVVVKHPMLEVVCSPKEMVQM